MTIRSPEREGTGGKVGAKERQNEASPFQIMHPATFRMYDELLVLGHREVLCWHSYDAAPVVRLPQNLRLALQRIRTVQRVDSRDGLEKRKVSRSKLLLRLNRDQLKGINRAIEALDRIEVEARIEREITMPQMGDELAAYGISTRSIQEMLTGRAFSQYRDLMALKKLRGDIVDWMSSVTGLVLDSRGSAGRLPMSVSSTRMKAWPGTRTELAEEVLVHWRKGEYPTVAEAARRIGGQYTYQGEPINVDSLAARARQLKTEDDKRQHPRVN